MRGIDPNFCLSCNRHRDDHKKITAEDIAASRGATVASPITLPSGFVARCPLSPATIGQYFSHDPFLPAKR